MKERSDTLVDPPKETQHHTNLMIFLTRLACIYMFVVSTRFVVVARVHDAAVPLGGALRHVVGFFQHKHLGRTRITATNATSTKRFKN